MLKKFSTYLFSYKSSVKNKPMALVMLLIVIIVSVVACGFVTRGLLQEVDNALYSNIKLDIPAEVTFNDRANMMRALRKNGLFNYDAMCDISCDFNLDIKANGVPAENKVKGMMKFDVYEGRYISEKEIVEGSQDIIIKVNVATMLNCKIGDELEFLGSKYIVKDIIPEYTGYYDGDIIMPYTSAPSDIKYVEYVYGDNSFETDIEMPFANFKMSHYGLDRLVNDSDNAIMSSYGVTVIPEKLETGPIIMLGALLLLFMVLAVLNLLYILNYFEKVGAKKYAVYNILGAKPRFIGMTMFIEIMSVTVIGLGLGALVDWLINISVQAFEFRDKLLWVHYLLSIGVIFVTALIATLIKIIRRRKAAPIDRRYM